MIILGIDRPLTNSIITMGGQQADIAKAEEWNNNHILSKEGEFSRLFLEILGYNAQTITVIDIEGNTVQKAIPAKAGFNLETATFATMKAFLNSQVKKSESQRELVRKVMAKRFPTEFDQERLIVSENLKQEYFLIKNESLQRTDIVNTLGECGGGVLGEVRLDGTTKRVPRRVRI